MSQSLGEPRAQAWREHRCIRPSWSNSKIDCPDKTERLTFRAANSCVYFNNCECGSVLPFSPGVSCWKWARLCRIYTRSCLHLIRVECKRVTAKKLCGHICFACEWEYQEADGRNLSLVKMVTHPESKFSMKFCVKADYLPIPHVSWKESTCVECTGMLPFAGQIHLVHVVVSFCRGKNTPRITTKNIQRDRNTEKYSSLHTTVTNWLKFHIE